MEPITAMLIVVGLIAMALGIGLVLTRRGRPRPQRSGEDYRALFVMGITYLPVGAIMTIVLVVAEGPWVIWLAMTALGLIFLTSGWTHREEWRHR
jgi:hypothetical protein